MNAANRLSIGQCATLACLLEVAAPKPGNVHRGADLADLTFGDFLTSAVAIGPAMQAAQDGASLGETVYWAVTATRRLVGKNTNLGTILLLAPLASVPREVPLAEGLPKVLSTLGAADARRVYEAIRLAEPGGMGKVKKWDLQDQPPDDLIAAMRQAADRDMVARQYVENFAQVLNCAAAWLVEELREGSSLSDTIVHTHLRLMSRFPDSLIARKGGLEVARQFAERARAVLAAGRPDELPYRFEVGCLEVSLRSDPYRHNPGTTADLIAAGLFADLRDGIISPPFD